MINEWLSYKLELRKEIRKKNLGEELFFELGPPWTPSWLRLCY